MWPFKKKTQKPRYPSQEGRAVGYVLVAAAGNASRKSMLVEEYIHNFLIDVEDGWLALEPGGVVRGTTTLTWEKEDDIPGLTDVAPSEQAAGDEAGEQVRPEGEPAP